MPQELPPPGGFPPILYVRNLPKRGLGTWGLFGSVAVLTAYGCYRYVKATKTIKEIKRETLQSRLNLLPLLTSEEDYRHSKRLHAQLQLERSVGIADPETSWHRQVYRQPIDSQRMSRGQGWQAPIGYVPRSTVLKEEAVRGKSEGNSWLGSRVSLLPYTSKIVVDDNMRPFEIMFAHELPPDRKDNLSPIA